MNTIIRYLTLAVFGGGGIALLGLGLAGEARAQTSTTCPLDTDTQYVFKPYICGVSTPSSGSTQKVTWRVTFSEPVTGVDWRDFMTDDTNDVVSPDLASNPGRKYGLGTVWEEIKKISDTVYEISMEWDCTASDNDCSHNEDFIPTYQVGARQDRYEGQVWLRLQSGAEFNETHSPASVITGTHEMPTARVDVY